jgi:sugar (pentulose or hexulose) kinase
LDGDIAERIGLRSGIPVAVASGDHQCAFAGAVSDYAGTVAVNVGTGGQASVFMPDSSSLRRKGEWPDYGSLELRPYVQGGYLLAGVGVVGGRSFRTLRDFFARTGEALFSVGGDADQVYSRLVTLAAESSPGAGGIEFQPFFTGTRREPGRKGEITGITPGNFTPGNLARSLFEGMARQLHASYAEAVSLGAPPRSALAGSGNGIRRNPVLRELLEAAFRMPLQLASQADEAATGAALCASVASGQFASIAEASRSFVTYSP